MNGPEHYEEAERLLSITGADGEDPRDPLIIAHAQVHATLALAAATAYPAVKDWWGDEDGSVSRGWAGVA